MPFILSPNFSKLFHKKNLPAKERLHGDGIKYDINSPEALDEIFFNNDDYPINKNAQKYFSYLEKANILFYNWKEAVLFLNKNYESIDNWWNDQKTQDARIKFCSNFAKDNNDKLNQLFRIITKV